MTGNGLRVGDWVVSKDDLFIPSLTGASALVFRKGGLYKIFSEEATAAFFDIESEFVFPDGTFYKYKVSWGLFHSIFDIPNFDNPFESFKNDSFVETKTEPACDCGAKTTYNTKDYEIGHANYCTVSHTKKNRDEEVTR